MAKKKRVGKVTRRRRKVGAQGEVTELIMRVVGVGLGAVGGAYVVQAGNTAIGSQVPAWAVPSMVGVAGLVCNLPPIAKKAPFVADIGMGLMGAGALLGLNQAGLNIPGISGLAMGNNAPPGTTVLSKAVGCAQPGKKVAGGPAHYLNKVVNGVNNNKKRRHAMAVGSLIMD
jgi:hypothetical protein